MTHLRGNGSALQNLSLDRRILAGGDSVTELFGDGNEAEGRAGAGHDDGRNCHFTQAREPYLLTFSVIKLERSDGPRHNLHIGISTVKKCFIFDERLD